MAPAIVDLDGIRTWYDERGTGEPVVLMHGGLTDSRDFAGSLDALAEGYRVLLPERRGHGHSPDVEGPFDLDTAASDTVAFLESVAGEPVRLVGFSAGAVVALRVAVRRPDLVSRLVLISGAYEYGTVLTRPAPGTPVPDAAATRHAEVSPDDPDHVQVVADKIVDSIEREVPLTPADLAGVRCPALVVAADDDVWPMEHTLALYRGLPAGELAVLPHTSHGLLAEEPALVLQLVRAFLAGRTRGVRAPIRRG